MGYKIFVKFRSVRRRISHEVMDSVKLCDEMRRTMVRVEGLEVAYGIEKPLSLNEMVQNLMERT